MSDEACACIAVRWSTVRHMSGETSGWWECLACDQRFIPQGASDLATASLRSRLASLEKELEEARADLRVEQNARIAEARANEEWEQAHYNVSLAYKNYVEHDTKKLDALTDRATKAEARAEEAEKGLLAANACVKDMLAERDTAEAALTRTREAAEAMAVALEEAAQVMQQKHENHCSEAWTSRDLHSPDCLLAEAEDARAALQRWREVGGK